MTNDIIMTAAIIFFICSYPISMHHHVTMDETGMTDMVDLCLTWLLLATARVQLSCVPHHIIF